MMGAGLDLEKTQWKNLELLDHRGKNIDNKDMANIIYHLFRCNVAHGKAIPEAYKIQTTHIPTVFQFFKGELHLPKTVIWGLIAICVFTEVNKGIEVQCDSYLTLGLNHFSVSDWWGLEEAFMPIAKKHNKFRIPLEGL